MSLFRKSKSSRRARKVVHAVIWTSMGTVFLVGLAIWLEARRNTDLADPTEGVTSVFKNSEGAPAPPIRFRDVAEEMGVTVRHGPGERGRTLPEDTGSGIAWGDYDGDGDWDLYVVSFPGPLGRKSEGESPDPEGSNRLYRNDGDRFTDVTAQAGVGDPGGFGMGATFADYDGDGDADLYVTNFGPNRLYRNRGDETFDEVAAAAGIDDPLWSAGAAWGDFDRDGHLDIYLSNYVRYNAGDIGTDLVMDATTGAYIIPFTLNPNSFDPEPNRLYHNRGDGTFEDIALLAGVENRDGRSLSATFCDLDGDGWLDLYVNNDVSTNRLYRNLGGDFGTDEPVVFADLSTMTGTADPRGSMGLSVAEIGGMGGEPDGLPDLFITHWLAQENAFYESMLTSGGDLEYRDKTRHLRLGEISIDTVGWGSTVVDFDLDGRIDVVVANGSTLEEKDNPKNLIGERIFLLWNDEKHFTDVGPAAGEALERTYWARGLAAADFDGDGDVDLAVAVNRGRPLLLRNETETTNRSLTVRLRAPASAHFGAKVTVTAGGEKQYRWCGADVTFLGMHATELIFGLGQRDVVDQIHVRWADGNESALTDVAAGPVVITHPETVPSPKPPAPPAKDLSTSA